MIGITLALYLVLIGKNVDTTLTQEDTYMVLDKWFIGNRTPDDISVIQRDEDIMKLIEETEDECERLWLELEYLT